MTTRLEHLVELAQVARPEAVIVVQQDVEAVAVACESQCTGCDEQRVPHSQ